MIERVKQWNLFVWFVITVAALLGVAGRARAQATGAEHISVTLTDPSRPATVDVGMNYGKLVVKGYDGKEITAEAWTSADEQEANASENGLKRIVGSATTGLSAQEANNKVTIGTQMYQQSVNLTIHVPYKTSLTLQSAGEITVSNVEGNLEVNSYGSDITLNNVAGSVIASVQMGKIVTTFTHVDPQKATAFSTYSGSIDVAFPSDLKANLLLNSGSGNVYSDFDIQVSQTAQQVVEDHRKDGGGYTVKVDKKIHGTIGGGGPDIQFTSLQGNIYIRKAKSTP